MGDEARALAEQLERREHRGGSRRRPRSSRRRRRSSRPTSRSGRARSSSWPGEGWHRGVIGIVASKLVDAFHRPAIVLSIDGDVAHGSCRSIPSFNMLAALESCADVMTKFGGHKQAAGLTHRGGAHPRAARARQRLRRRVPRAGRPAAAAVDRRRADVPRASTSRSRRSWRRWRRSAPATRAGVPRPAASRSSTVRGGSRSAISRWRSSRTAGSCAASPGAPPSARASSPSIARAIDLAFSLEQDTWNGERYLQLSVADFRAPEGARAPGAEGDGVRFLRRNPTPTRTATRLVRGAVPPAILIPRT